MIPKKRNGFRKITIDTTIYCWRLNGVIEIRPDQNQSNKLEIDFGYFDYWEFVNHPEERPADFEPKIVTPGFIKIIIQNAIQLGWNVNNKNNTTRLKYRNNEFEF
ncbi:hypothetical protein [Flavobacterium aquidurense]|uniref:Uncharacterized protein n=1 Tax=Flavobacterium aquidurense TaxID=362413 RepID=A0A0Q0RSW8_9FLAO|nr:hypothetical protein [Flavobacterium aquidurense]KQB39799.1 hypothetical protein RC62_1493 [Flavobacterium aquidurense]